MTSKTLYEEMTWPETQEAVAEGRVAILPTGSTEQHGPHLPLSTDVLCSYSVCKKVAETVPRDAVVFPPVWYGFNEHHADFPGTLWVDWQPFIAYLIEIGRSAVHHGFRKLVIVNGHGSNTPFTQIAARKITNTTDAICAALNYWDFGQEAITKVRESEWPGGMAHACELETSLLLYLAPHLVDMKKAKKRDISFPKSKYIYWDLQGGAVGGKVAFMDQWSRISKTGIIGDPRLATRKKGKIVFESVVENLSDFVREFKVREIRERVDHHDHRPHP
jgi:creatinine amidohydrolase